MKLYANIVKIVNNLSSLRQGFCERGHLLLWDFECCQFNRITNQNNSI